MLHELQVFLIDTPLDVRWDGVGEHVVFLPLLDQCLGEGNAV